MSLVNGDLLFMIFRLIEAELKAGLAASSLEQFAVAPKN